MKDWAKLPNLGYTHKLIKSVKSTFDSRNCGDADPANWDAGCTNNVNNINEVASQIWRGSA